MPKLWDQTIQAHRHQVRDKILDTTATLVATHGLLSVTMSQIAEQTGISRATLYHYFPDVEAIVRAWHRRQITGHLQQLADARDQAGDAGQRLRAVLAAYARIVHQSRSHHDTELAALMHHDHHHDEHLGGAQQQLRELFGALLAEAAAAGEVRDDVAPSELAAYCLHALTAASSLPSTAAVGRLVAVTLAGLRTPVASS